LKPFDIYKRILLHGKSLFTQSKPPVHFILTGAESAIQPCLIDYMQQQANIGLAPNPSCHFFDQKTSLFQNLNTNKYIQSFPVNKSIKALGDITPSYFYWQTAPRRIYEFNPKTKIILILQNPVDRAFTHWQQNRQLNIEPLMFDDALLAENERAKSYLPFQDIQFGYTDAGYYSEAIRRYQRYFKEHHLLFISYNDFLHQPNETCNKIATFLNVNLKGVYTPTHHHTNIPIHTRQRLLEQYYYDIRETERLLQWNLSAWLETPKTLPNG
jgi:hypothetical protein